MTMHTTLSGSVAQALLLVLRRFTTDEGPVRLCYGNPKKTPHLALSLTIEFLIANLELEFRLTHRKISPLKISNRKYSAIFCLAFHAHSPLTCSKEVSAPTFLIATFTNSKIESSHCKQSRKQNSNSNKTGISGNCGAPNLEQLEVTFLAGFLTACLVTLVVPSVAASPSEGRRRKKLEIRRHHHRLRASGQPSLLSAHRTRLDRRAHRKIVSRRHLHQHRLHADEDDDRFRPSGALRSHWQEMGRQHGRRERGSSRDCGSQERGSARFPRWPAAPRR